MEWKELCYKVPQEHVGVWKNDEVKEAVDRENTCKKIYLFVYLYTTFIIIIIANNSRQ